MRPPIVALIVAISLAAAAPLAKAEDDARPSAERVAVLVQAIGVEDTAAQMIGLVMQQLRPVFPNVPQELWEEVENGFDAQEFTRLMIPVYQNQLTAKEVEGVIAFYRSPVGKSFAKKQFVIAQESMAVGAAYGQQIANEVIKKLQARGYGPVQS